MQDNHEETLRKQANYIEELKTETRNMKKLLKTQAYFIESLRDKLNSKQEFDEYQYLYELFKNGTAIEGDILKNQENISFSSNSPKNRPKIKEFRNLLQRKNIITTSPNATWALCNFNTALKTIEQYRS